MDPEVIPVFRFAAALAMAASLAACRLEPPDPASEAAAILHKRPSDFIDQLASLDALGVREEALLSAPADAKAPAFRPMLAESLYAYAQRLRPALAAITTADAAGDSARIDLLRAFVFDTLGIKPLSDGAPLYASVPSLVLSRKEGSCVGLVLLYLALGRSTGIPLAPVFLPGHIMVRHIPDGRPSRNIETLRRGILRSDSFYRETFSLGKRPWYSLREAAPGQALAALVFNLANARRDAGDLKTAAGEYQLVEQALPGFPEALGNQGVCLMMDGERTRAREKFLAALAGDSLSEAARANLASLAGGAPPAIESGTPP
jgi:regulator of sirC expression with transglutaminase-like and TPR domain